MSNYSYTIELLKEQEGKLLDARDVINSKGESSEWVNIKIKDIESSIKTLEAQSEAAIENLNGTPLTVTTTLDMFNGVWDKSQMDQVSKILNGIWKKNIDDLTNNPKTKDEALKHLKNFNNGAKPEQIVTRLRYNNGKDYVQDFSFFVNNGYMSNDLLEALQKGQTLTDDLEKELNTYIIEKSI